jgi:hypothetical protein
MSDFRLICCCVACRCSCDLHGFLCDRCDQYLVSQDEFDEFVEGGLGVLPPMPLSRLCHAGEDPGTEEWLSTLRLGLRLLPLDCVQTR